MTTLLAIDPGNAQSGWCLIDLDTRKPIAFGKDDNIRLRDHIWSSVPLARLGFDHVAIEMVASYGMAVGREVFETCVWIGRFYTAAECKTGDEPRLVYRRDIKLHHCHSAKAKDSNIRQALVDRFAAGQPNHGKGTKASPGWFHGFAADVWQAYALGVHVADRLAGLAEAPSPTPSTAIGAPF